MKTLEQMAEEHLEHLEHCRRICAEHPVPLPSNPEMLRDLASIGVP